MPCGAVLFFLFRTYQVSIRYMYVRKWNNKKKAHPAQLSLAQRSSAAQCSAVQRRSVPCPALPYGAVPCRAVLCRAVPRCVMPCSAFSFVHMKRGIYVHACGVRVVFLEHEALGICKSPVLHLKGRAIYHIFHSVPFFLVSERSGLDRPLTRAPYIPRHSPLCLPTMFGSGCCVPS